jgi:hypothetical protein
MKRLTLLLAPLLVLLAACDLSSVPFQPGDSGQSVHHKRTGDQAIVNVTIDPTAEVLRPYIEDSIAEWSQAKYLDMVEAPCLPDANCIIVRGRPMNGGTAGICTGCQHFSDYGPVDIWFDNSPGQHPDNVDNGLCHEFGHAAGLDHGNVPGPCQDGQPTGWDLAVVDTIHDHKDPSP